MSTTLDDIKRLIRDEVGGAVADRWEELRAKGEEDKVQRKFTHSLGGQRERKHDDDKPRQKGMNAATCIRMLYRAQGDMHRAADYADQAGYKTVAKALGESTLAGGGALLPPEFSQEIIELLDARTVVRQMGPTRLPMNSGSLTLPFVNTGSTASYVGENQNITASQPSFGQIQLSDKKLAAVIPTSNDLLRNGGDRVDRVLRDDLVRAMAVKEDATLLRSAGTSNEPKGMLFLAEAANKVAQSGTAVADITNDLAAAVKRVEEDNVAIDSGGWLMAPRTKWHLLSQRDGNGNLVWEPEMRNGTLMGFPFMTTTSIPVNLGGGSNESEFYFANFSDLVLAENESIQVEVFPGAAYWDGSSVVSGVSQDQTVIRAIALHDFAARFRGKEISVITGVTWGA